MSPTTCGPAHGIEVVVLAIGCFNGGTVGIGTVFFAATIGFSISASLNVTDRIVRMLDND